MIHHFSEGEEVAEIVRFSPQSEHLQHLIAEEQRLLAHLGRLRSAIDTLIEEETNDH